MTRTAKCTIALLTVNLAVYVVMFLCWLCRSHFPGLTDAVSDMLMLPSSFPAIIEHPWTIVTYMFSQVSFIHLAVNMLWLIGFGGMMKASPKMLVATYVGGGVAGAVSYLAYTMLAGGIQPPLAGASSSVIAIVVATTILTPNRKVGLLWFWEIKLKWLAPMALITIFAGFGGAAWAHLGGLASGTVSGLVLRFLDSAKSRRNLIKAKEELDRRKRIARRDSIIAKVGSSGFSSLTEHERLEIFNLSKPASGE